MSGARRQYHGASNASEPFRARRHAGQTATALNTHLHLQLLTILPLTHPPPSSPSHTLLSYDIVSPIQTQYSGTNYNTSLVSRESGFQSGARQHHSVYRFSHPFHQPSQEQHQVDGEELRLTRALFCSLTPSTYHHWI